jgi:hypothetical protein
MSFTLLALAEAQSVNYSIKNSVFSSGGTQAASTNHEIESTIGQPSPLLNPVDPPKSNIYNLFPGFWYTVTASGTRCLGNTDGDNDVDGYDLDNYILNSMGITLEDFAIGFGRIDCTAE